MYTQYPKTEPFFIVGVHRSGTTMLRLMVNNHPNIAVPFESVFIPEFYRRLADYGDLTKQESVANLLRDIAAHPFVRRGGLIPGDMDTILARPIKSYADLIHAIF
ncbi:sulfotransferase [Nitrosococcus halophilus]|uniref:sulfotransferase n=1 Tax=Nitrosococcus halophilus TaxID=133539 RepID=UPI000309C488|nr:sulfotransferase [Nitrosococcus halophilus]